MYGGRVAERGATRGDVQPPAASLHEGARRGDPDPAPRPQTGAPGDARGPSSPDGCPFRLRCSYADDVCAAYRSPTVGRTGRRLPPRRAAPRRGDRMTAPLLEMDGLVKRFHLPSGQTGPPSTASPSPSDPARSSGWSASRDRASRRWPMSSRSRRPGRRHRDVRRRPLKSWLGDEPRAYRRQVQAVFQQPVLALDPLRTIGWSIAEPWRSTPPAGGGSSGRVAELLTRWASTTAWQLADRRSSPAANSSA